MDERKRLRDERSQRAVAAAVGLARNHGLAVDEPEVLHELFSVTIHLKPAPVVARVSTYTSKVRTPIADWTAREIDVTTFLAAQGAPVVTPSRELPPGPHNHGGFPISFWTYLERDNDRDLPTADECSAMLVDLHGALRTYAGDLPTLGPATNDIPIGVAALDKAGDVLTAGEIDQLRAAADRWWPFVTDPPGDVQPLHGDVHPGNLLPTKDGFVWLDFEDVCQGPVEWDFALLDWMDHAALSAHHQPDPDLLARCSDLRALHLSLCMAAFRGDFGDLDGYDTFLRPTTWTGWRV